MQITLSLSDTRKPATTIIGAGALGTALARRMRGVGYPVVAVISHSATDAAVLAEQLEDCDASDDLADLPAETRLVCCCVPDTKVTSLAEELAQHVHPWYETVVLHTSGVLSSEVLAPLTAKGATPLSFHPMQTFPPETSPDAFSGIYIGIEGAREAVDLGVQLAGDLGAEHVILTPETKTRYHLAASMASNFFVGLMGIVAEVLSDIGLDRPEGAALIRPLVASTWQNLAQGLPEDVLTGPIARGDVQTVRAHTAALQVHLPHLLLTYVTMATETIRVAVRGGHLDEATAQALLDTLHDALQPPKDILY